MGVLNDLAGPTFLVCGAMKSGTTALYEYLKQHPDIYMSDTKETGYFDVSYGKGAGWYSSFFLERKITLQEGRPHLVTCRTRLQHNESRSTFQMYAAFLFSEIQ
jgi:hypothetical protein